MPAYVSYASKKFLVSSLENSNYGRAKTVPKLRIASWSVGSFKRRRFAEIREN